MEKFEISKVPWLAAEDETAIEPIIVYHQETDELLGFCGKLTDNPKEHQCLVDFHLYVGDDDDSYNRIVNAFNEYKIGKNARVILLNPLHKFLPRIVICLMPTCNCFTHHAVYRQWQAIEKLF